MINLNLSTKLGQGAHGEVYKIFFRDTFKAVKVINKNKRDKIKINREIDIMKRLSNCSKIIKFEDYLETTENFYIIMEYFEGFTGEDYIYSISSNNHSVNLVNEKQIKKWFYDICIALKECHENEIIHNDIKPGNIMLNNSECKLIDFGTSQYNNDKLRMSGTPIFFSIEKLNYVLDYKSDVWSLGITLYRMITGKHPFLRKEVRNLNDLKKELEINILEFDLNSKHKFSKELLNLIQHMLIKDYKYRPSIKDILNHPWFEDL